MTLAVSERDDRRDKIETGYKYISMIGFRVPFADSIARGRLEELRRGDESTY